MIQFDNGGILVKRISEIPSSFIGAKKIYLDTETSSRNHALDSLNPWHNCWICGFSITVDDCPNAYYADQRYTEGFWQNGPQFVQNLLWYGVEWVNHHIKYDMHVFTNSFGITLPKHLRYKCTLVSSRLIDSDRGGARGGYGMTALSKDWLKHDILPYEDRLRPYLGRNNKDYGRIPSDVIGEYGCQDALTERNLDNHISARLPTRCNQVAETEIKLTRYLWELENNGMRYDENKMRMAQLHTLNRMNQLDTELASITGMDFRPAVSDDCCKVLCGKYGLPIVAYTKDDEGADTDRASFDKKALALYSAILDAPHNVIDKIKEFRKLSQRNSLFYSPILDADWGGCLHATYGQNDARTGRMVCKQPNAQQFDETVLGLMEPAYGDSFISTDASQIEKRLVVHYIQDEKAIAAYQADSATDFYKLTAQLCGISRQAAKAVDLGIGYGEGQKKLIAALKINPDVVAWAKAEVDKLGLTDIKLRDAAFDQLASSRGTMIYKVYHETYPSLKPTAKEAELAVKSRNLGLAGDADHLYGYVTNLYGRDRHIPYYRYRRTDFKTKDPYDRAWLAFPTLNQGTAADLMKERFVALMEAIGSLPIKPVAIVHDEILLTAPTEIANDPRCCRDIVAILESPAVKIDVPIRWSIGVSDQNWLAAATPVKDGGVSQLLQYNKSEAQEFGWLK